MEQKQLKRNEMRRRERKLFLKYATVSQRASAVWDLMLLSLLQVPLLLPPLLLQPMLQLPLLLLPSVVFPVFLLALKLIPLPQHLLAFSYSSCAYCLLSYTNCSASLFPYCFYHYFSYSCSCCSTALLVVIVASLGKVQFP